MSYKDELIFLLNSGNELESSLEKVFSKALNESKITGESLESILYELLEGLENLNLDKKDLLKNIELLLILILKSTKKNIDIAYKNYIISKKICKEKIDREYALIEEFLEIIINFAKEHKKDYLIEEYNNKKKEIFETLRYNIIKKRI